MLPAKRADQTLTDAKAYAFPGEASFVGDDHIALFEVDLVDAENALELKSQPYQVGGEVVVEPNPDDIGFLRPVRGDLMRWTIGYGRVYCDRFLHAVLLVASLRGLPGRLLVDVRGIGGYTYSASAHVYII